MHKWRHGHIIPPPRSQEGGGPEPIIQGQQGLSADMAAATFSFQTLLKCSLRDGVPGVLGFHLFADPAEYQPGSSVEYVMKLRFGAGGTSREFFMYGANGDAVTPSGTGLGFSGPENYGLPSLTNPRLGMILPCQQLELSVSAPGDTPIKIGAYAFHSSSYVPTPWVPSVQGPEEVTIAAGASNSWRIPPDAVECMIRCEDETVNQGQVRLIRDVHLVGNGNPPIWFPVRADGLSAGDTIRVTNTGPAAARFWPLWKIQF